MAAKCEPCLRQGKNQQAQFTCRDCEEALCLLCRRDHFKFGRFLNHQIILRTPGQNSMAKNQEEDDKEEKDNKINPSYLKSKDLNREIVGDDGSPPKVNSVEMEENPGNMNGDVVKAVLHENSCIGQDDDSTYLSPISMSKYPSAEPRHFPVHVENTELAIKTGISTQFGYIIVTSAHLIFASDQCCISIGFVVIRKFSFFIESKSVFQVEVGRKFEHNEGFFRFVASQADALDMFTHCNDTAKILALNRQ